MDPSASRGALRPLGGGGAPSRPQGPITEPEPEPEPEPARKASPDHLDRDGGTALSWAARHGHGNAVDALVSMVGDGAALETEGENGRSPLAWAAQGGHLSVLEASPFVDPPPNAHLAPNQN